MTKYSVTGPDGARYSIEGPEGMSDAQVITEIQRQLGGGQPAPEPPPQSWGEYAGGLARQAAQGLTFGFADEAEAGLRSLGDADYDTTVADIRRQNEAFAGANPIASTVAHIAGGVPLFVGPGGAATGLARAAQWANQGGMLARMGRGAVLGSGTGAVSGFGAGEGDIRTPEGLGSRAQSAQMGGLFGAGIGAAAPPVLSAVGAGVRSIGGMVSPLTRSLRTPSEPPLPFSTFDRPPGSPPIEGARFINDMAPGEVANAQTRALGAIRDALVREGRTPAQIEAQLDEFATWASRFNTSSYGQDVVTAADLSPGLQRLLGSLARQSPEAARDVATFLQARQTGITPQGADAIRLGQRGIPTRQRFAEPVTGQQAADEFGSTFQRAPGGDLRTGQGNVQPMGHWARSMDFLKRAFGIKDSDFHGHAANPGRTVEQIAQSMKEGARRSYGDTYRMGERVDLTPTIEPVVQRWAQLAETAQPPLAGALRRAVRLFRRPDGSVVRDIKNFDLYGKQYLDDEIGKAFRAGDNAIGRELTTFRDEIIGALDNATDARTRVIARLYARARGEYSDRMRVQGIVERFRDESFGGDPRSLLQFYDTLSREEQKLARLGVQWAVEKATGRTGEARQILGLFRTPEADQLLRGIIQRSSGSGEFANRPERFGRAIDVEGLFPETRQVARGGSQTAERVQDDLMQVALDASQNVQTLMSVLRGNQSLYQLVERAFALVWDRAFGVGADAAREATRMLLTANPAERAAMLQQVAAIMPANRMAQFSELTRRLAGSVGGASASAVGAAAGAPQGGATFL
jgi:hypothetical protein